MREPLAFQREEGSWHLLIFAERHDVAILHLRKLFLYRGTFQLPLYHFVGVPHHSKATAR